MTWEAGHQIGAFEIIRTIGVGGMGRIYHAVHGILGRHVALKQLHPHLLEMPEMTGRFLREGRALSRLQHHGIVTLYDFISHNQDTYMVLEYVDGIDLRELLKEGPVEPDIAAIIGLRLADALEHAHVQGITHRDIKPSNLMLSKQGQVKLMDFGIARGKDLAVITATRDIVGTPSYIAPEMLTQEHPDSRSDIHSVGVLLYEAIAGHPPYQGTSPQLIFQKIVDGDHLKLSKVQPKTPRALCHIIEECLATSPDKRYQSAAQLRQALEAFLITHGANASHTERLIGFLHTRRILSEAEALHLVNPQVLEQTGHFRLRAPLLRPWMWMMAITALGMAGIVRIWF